MMKAADQEQPARGGGGGEKHGGSSSPKNTYRLHVLFSEAAMDFSLSLSLSLLLSPEEEDFTSAHFTSPQLTLIFDIKAVALNRQRTHTHSLPSQQLILLQQLQSVSNQETASRCSR